MRYRRSVYRKRRIKIAIIVSLCVLAVLALAFVIIGNALGDKVDENRTNDSTSESTGGDTALKDIRMVNAYPVALSEDGSTLATRLSRAQNKGYTDICFDLDTEDGTLQYISDIAVSLGKQQSSPPDLRSLDNIVGLFEDDGLYSIGIAHIPEFGSDDDLVRSAAIGYHSAQISEALREGVDDVLVYAGDIPADRYEELIHLAQEVHRLSPDGVVGIALSPSVLSDSSDIENKELIYRLSLTFDYLAADLSVIGNNSDNNNTSEEIDAAEYIDGELGKMLLYVLQYKMRVLIPYSDDAALTESISTVIANRDIKNVQIMPK